MLELRYNTTTKEITGWCGDPAQFGNLLDRGGEAVVILDIGIPPLDIDAYLFDEASQSLIPNPAYPLIDPDTLRAEELLQSSPNVITMPEMWELFRIFGRRLGYHF